MIAAAILKSANWKLKLSALLLTICSFILTSHQIEAGQDKGTPDHLWGVNLAGAEFGNGRGQLNKDYNYPTEAQIAYYASRGAKLIRIPFLSWRLLSSGNISIPDIDSLKTAVAAAQRFGLTAVLDRHEYAIKEDGTPLSTSDQDLRNFRQTWFEIAKEFAEYDNVWFGIMNEPHLQKPTDWVEIANAGISGVLEAKPDAMVTVMGSRWGSAAGFISSGNGAAFQKLNYRQSNVIIELHQYLDDGSGKPDKAVHPGAGSRSLIDATAWAKQNNAKLFLGEYAFTPDPQYSEEGQALINYMKMNSKTWIGSAYWAGGLKWAEGRSTYKFSIEPRDFSVKVDRPQMEILKDVQLITSF